MAAKKAASKKAASRSPKNNQQWAEGMRYTLKAKEANRGKKAAGERLSEFERKNRGLVYQGEGGFYSTGLANKADRDTAAERAKKLKQASQQMKQGVTKSGGYAGSRSQVSDLRGVKSGKFKAEQAVKKTGSMTRNSGNKKKNAK
jgi:hypothetical protein